MEELVEQEKFSGFPRVAEMIHGAKGLSEAERTTELESAAKEILSFIEQCFPDTKGRSVVAVRERAACNFHKLSLAAIRDLWKNLLSKANVPLSDPLLTQTLNQKLFDSICRTKLGRSSSAESYEEAVESMSAEGENALRYAAGFIPYKLLKKYEADSSAKAVLYCRCLRQMAAVEEICQNDHDYSYLDYTTMWLDFVDRGGLFRVKVARGLLGAWLALPGRGVLSRIFGHETRTLA